MTGAVDPNAIPIEDRRRMVLARDNQNAASTKLLEKGLVGEKLTKQGTNAALAGNMLGGLAEIEKGGNARNGASQIGSRRNTA